jgi:uncharacterized BrkB/YihY/UPF0761 family membrane protein
MEWAWLIPGSLLATTRWLAASAGFKVCVQNVGSYAAMHKD